MDNERSFERALIVGGFFAIVGIASLGFAIYVAFTGAEICL